MFEPNYLVINRIVVKNFSLRATNGNHYQQQTGQKDSWIHECVHNVVLMYQLNIERQINVAIPVVIIADIRLNV